MTSESQTLMLQPYCDARGMASLLDQLRQRCPGDLVIDAAGVKSITSQCLQILLSADLEYRTSGGSLELTNADNALTECLSVLGVPPNRFSAEDSE